MDLTLDLPWTMSRLVLSRYGISFHLSLGPAAEYARIGEYRAKAFFSRFPEEATLKVEEKPENQEPKASSHSHKGGK